MNNIPQNLDPLGEIIKPHGINGELKVFLYNDKSDTLKKGVKVWFNINDCYRNYSLYSIRGSTKNIIIKLDQLDNINQTKELINQKILVSRNDFIELGSKSFYLNDLIGFKVFDIKNDECGKIIDVLSFSGNDVLLVDYKNKEIMIPIVDDALITPHAEEWQAVIWHLLVNYSYEN